MEEKQKQNHNKKKKKKVEEEFEFCKVCKLNHNQGRRRHNYIPNHTKSLSSFLSRFLTKLSDLRFFLKNPTLLRPEHATRNRLWCVFCDSDIQELDSLFACNNAIRHLASSEHFKNVKHFLYKYGGGMDRVDSFRVSDIDLAQWENKCNTLKNATSSSSSRIFGPVLGGSNDIPDKTYSHNLDSFERNRFHSFELSVSNGFLPLQNFTNEKIQVSHRKASGVAGLAPRPQETTFPVDTHDSMDLQGMHVKENISNVLTVYRNNKQIGVDDCRKSSVCWSPSLGRVGRLVNGESSYQEGSNTNVHSGAPPPWLGRTEEIQLNDQVSTGIHMNGKVSSSTKSGKSQKLNPNRVGAAWAEKRKIELEMEKRGEAVTNNCDSNWLPNFGRVWQSGSRKESRKEFETEKEKSLKTNILSEMPIKIQPYISKRMRKESGDSKEGDCGNFR